MSEPPEPEGTGPPPLVCYECGATAAFPDRERCECGEPLWFDTSEAAAAFDWPAEDLGTGVWRYADLLPFGSAETADQVESVAAAAGDTPLVRTSRLDDYAGCRLWLKDERANPTGSFKDRGSAVGATWAADANRERLGTVSHGNMAVSVAANAAGVGSEAVVLVPDDVAPARLTAIAEYDPTILRVDGDYGALYRETLDADSGIAFLNSDVALRVAGQKTTALEVCEAFARGDGAPGTDGGTERCTPDAIVLPVSSGGHASAAWKAIRELRRAGLLGDDLPRLYLVQAAACDPIARAFRAGADEVTPTEAGETVAYSIANPDPPSGTRALAAARDTGGAVVSVPDDEIRDAKKRLARDAGFAVEAASATALAGIRKLSASGDIDANERAVAVLTGRGFAGTGNGEIPDVETVALADVRDRLEELV